jgi:hypothetical protein
MVTLECGHDVENYGQSFDLMIKIVREDGRQDIRFLQACADCVEVHRDQLASSMEDAANWKGVSVENLFDPLP